MLFLPSEIPGIRKGGSQRNPAPALEANGIRNILFLILTENLLLLLKKKKNWPFYFVPAMHTFFSRNYQSHLTIITIASAGHISAQKTSEPLNSGARSLLLDSSSIHAGL